MLHFVTFTVKLSLRVALTGRCGPGGDDTAVTFHFSDVTQYHSGFIPLLLRSTLDLHQNLL